MNSNWLNISHCMSPVGHLLPMIAIRMLLCDSVCRCKLYSYGVIYIFIIYILMKLWSPWLYVWLFEAVRTNPGYGMATLIYNNLLNLILEVSRIIVPQVTQLLRSKWLNLFSRCTERKNESFWPKNLGQDFFLSVTQLFRSNFKFRLCFNFLGQDDSFFLSVHEAKKLSHFNLKIWVKF